MNNSTPNKPRAVSRRRAIVAVVAAAGVATIGTALAEAAVAPASPTATRSPFLASAVAPGGPRSAADPRIDQVAAVLEHQVKTYGDVLAMTAEAVWVRTAQAKHAARIGDAERAYRADPTLDNFDALESAFIDAEDARARQAVIAGFHFGHGFQDRPFEEARQWFSAEAMELTPADFR